MNKQMQECITITAMVLIGGTTPHKGRGMAKAAQAQEECSPRHHHRRLNEITPAHAQHTSSATNRSQQATQEHHHNNNQQEWGRCSRRSTVAMNVVHE